MHSSPAKCSLGTPRLTSVPPSPCNSFLSSALPCRFQILQSPHALISVSLFQQDCCDRVHSNILPKPENSSLEEGQDYDHQTHLMNFPSLRIKILCFLLSSICKELSHTFISSRCVIVYCRRTGLLPVIARIGSPFLKHSFLTQVHFFKKVSLDHPNQGDFILISW